MESNPDVRSADSGPQSPPADTAATPGSQEASPADDSTTEKDSAESESTTEAFSDPPDNASDQRMPDPSSLMVMAAMHLGTAELLQGLVHVFDAHAWRAMGLIADQTGEARKDMPSAQLAIDCFAFVLSKIDSGLSDAERRDVQRRLTDLRMNYVAKLRDDPQ